MWLRNGSNKIDLGIILPPPSLPPQGKMCGLIIAGSRGHYMAIFLNSPLPVVDYVFTLIATVFIITIYEVVGEIMLLICQQLKLLYVYRLERLTSVSVLRRSQQFPWVFWPGDPEVSRVLCVCVIEHDALGVITPWHQTKILK